jgi:hypothetical protein
VSGSRVLVWCASVAVHVTQPCSSAPARASSVTCGRRCRNLALLA